MRLLSILCGFVLLVQSCVCLDELEAARIVYYYSMYDFDATVHGAGNNHIAKECKSTVLVGAKCTFTEFVNFIDLGAAAAEPKYYDLSGSFTFVAGDVMAMTTALVALFKSPERDVLGRVVMGRNSPVGIFDDLATIMDRNHVRAKASNLGVRRHVTNIGEALGGLRAVQSSRLEGGFYDRMRTYRQDVVWKIVQRESAYRSQPWNKIDWQATVAANPDLGLANSEMYKNTVKALKGFDTQVGTLQEKTMASKAAETFLKCYLK